MSSGIRVAFVPGAQAQGGAPADALVHGLAERGWDPHVVTPGAPAARRRLRGADIVHFLGAAAARDGVAAETNGARAVASFSAIDASVTGLQTSGYYQPLWRRAAALLFPDEAVLASALERGCPPDKPRAVIPPLVDMAAFEPNGGSPPAPAGDGARPLRVLCAGPLEWSGGYEDGLHALALARERGVATECRVVGSGSHRPALLFARHQLGLAGSVAFEEGAALREHLEWADVFLAPTLINGLPEHVVEACAMRLCVVVADPGPLGAVRLDPPAAITVPRRDPHAVADALVRLGADLGLRRALGAEASRWARERFAPDDHLDRLDGLYRSVLA